MATACERLDELVKDYLFFRGFTTTTKTLDYEIKHDKDKGLRADRIVEQLMAYVGSHDLQHLREYWGHLNQRFFSRLEQRYAVSVRKLEVSLWKLYVVNAQQNNRQDRVRDFFEKLGPELQNQLEFRDWFAFQFLPNPSENGSFALYFTRQWQETVQLSLHNFLQVILQAMPVPALLNFEQDSKRMQALQDENDFLRNQIRFGTPAEKIKGYRMKTTEKMTSIPQPLPDLIYDFSGLADTSNESKADTGSERQKPTRRFPMNLSTPLLKRNRQAAPQQDSTAGSQQQSSHGNQSSNNSSVDSLAHPVTQGGTSVSASGQGVASSTHASGGIVTTAAQRTGGGRAAGDTQSSSASQQSGSTEASAVSGMPQKKTAKEMISFPPYTSPMAERGDPLPARSRGLSAPDRAFQQGQGDKSAGRLESAVEEAGSVESQLTVPVDYGPVESLRPIPEGKQCPFLVLSDDEYLEHQSAICYSRFSLTGQHIASLDTNGIVKVWTWSPQPSTTATVMSRAPFLSLDWASKSDRWLLIGNQSGQIRLFDTREIKTFREASVESSQMKVTYLSTCPSTMTFASCLTPISPDPGVDAGKLAIWDLKTMKMERYLPIDPGTASMSCCVHNSNGKLLLAGSHEGIIRLYDLNQRQCVKTWKSGDTPVQTIQFAHQETSFFVMGPDRTLQEWSMAQTNRPIQQIRISDNATHDLPGGQLFSLNKDKSYMLCGMQQRGVISKVDEGHTKGSMQKILELSPHGDVVTTVDWSPNIDTPVCVTGARDGHLKVATLLSQ
ncbi:WD repeat-containing protein 91-like [Littorina saxatilis]|uniref:WD repeat-containing protein 91 n=1 Tax=Littorina saxatilis TaxID=31220 RepID=A0AAN9GJU4_9CAEN